MSTSRGSGAAGNGGGVQSIPAGSRKMVQSLKEIVSCSEAEIYAVLKDCNMDPNEAVNRLLSQDPFHEVKSKREKKKEGKDTTEPRSRGANNPSRSGKAGADRYVGRGGSTSYNSFESGTLPGKTTYKKEHGSTSYASSTMPAVSTNSRSGVSAELSNGDHATDENKGPSFGAAVSMPSGVQPVSGYQSAWVGAPGQVSMADIVKMGRPQNKASNAPQASHHNAQGPSTNKSYYNSRFPADNSMKDHESGTSSAQQIPIIEEWPIMPPATKVVSIPYFTPDSEQHLEASVIPSDGFNQPSEVEEVQEEEYASSEESGENAVESDSISSRMLLEDDSRGASLYENDLYKDAGSYQHQAPNDFQEVEEINASLSSVTRNLQQLSVENDDRGLPSEGYNTPSVVIPDHLQVQHVDCSHLSFGSFGSGMGAGYSSDTVKSVPVEPNLEKLHSEADIPSVGHMDRSSDYYVDDSLRNASDGGMLQRSSANAGDYDPASASQHEELKSDNAEGAHGSQYTFPPSNPGYNFDGAQQINPTFNQTSSQLQNLAPFSDVMSYTNALPSSLSPVNVQPTRESDLQYSQFLAAQAMSAKFGNSVASVDGSAISMSEALKTAGYTLTQSAPQTLPGSSGATGPTLAQHLAVHPYSQPTLPLGPFANMFGYPYLPQSYTYLPSTFQQTFAGNSSYPQSIAAVLPQYKSNVSASSLPQSAAIASGYGAFGNPTTIQGNYPMNPPAAPSGSTLSYDDVLNSQYKDNSHLVSLQQQNENSAMWLHGANSRTMSAVPASTYYNYQGQNQQSSGFRQGQQPSQNYGYPNFYHSQSGLSLEQQQNPRDGSLGGSQGQQQQQPKQSQIWQNSY